MITNKQKELAHDMLAFAKANGCTGCRISIATGTESSFEYRNRQLDQLQQSAQNQMSIALFVDGRYGNFSTNRMEASELKKFILNGIDATRYLAPDANRKLPAPETYYRGNDASDSNYDKTFGTLQPDDKVQLAKNTVDEVLGTNPAIISVTASYGDNENFNYIADSQGFEGESAKTMFSLTSEVSLKGKGDKRPESWWYDSTLFWDKLTKQGIGRTALARALKKLGQEKIKSGVYPMLVDNMNVDNLLSPLVEAMNGRSLAMRDSFLLGRMGERIAAPCLQITDEPHLPQAHGSRMFDTEGVATVKRDIIKDGILNTYFLDTYNAGRLQMPATISGPSVLTFRPGTRNMQELMAGMKRGILVTGFNGGNSNSATGDFSFGVEGFLIENGQTVKPVSEMNITGNMLALWQSLVEVGNDVRTNSAWRSPSLLFEGVSFSGN